MSTKIAPPGFTNETYDRLFKAIFGRENPQSKQWRLELYNALRGTNYKDPDKLEINTIENVIYLTMRNDISFLVDSQMTLFEQQSTYNPNMPLRGFMYFSQLYQIHITKTGKSLHHSSLVKIPYPKFIVFYNGNKETPDREYLKLSDAFENKEKDGDFEWTAELININPNHNKTLQKNCKPLYHYVKYVARIKHNKQKGLPPQAAISEAVDWAIKKKLLNGFFKLQKEEVLAMSLTEFNAEEVTREFIEEGREMGRDEKALEDAENLLKLNKLTEDEIAQAIGIPLDQVLKLKEKITVLA
ncbi:MAG: hypothetical protein K5907_00795 [Treponema sp.]|nr:hypothetical protein [Treponema sp.]